MQIEQDRIAREQAAMWAEVQRITAGLAAAEDAAAATVDADARRGVMAAVFGCCR